MGAPTSEISSVDDAPTDQSRSRGALEPPAAPFRKRSTLVSLHKQNEGGCACSISCLSKRSYIFKAHLLRVNRVASPSWIKCVEEESRVACGPRQSLRLRVAVFTLRAWTFGCCDCFSCFNVNSPLFISNFKF